MQYLKNPNGAIVPLDDERAEFLLEKNPTQNRNGVIVPIAKSNHEIGWSKPTKAEIDEYEKRHGGQKPAKLEKPADPPKEDAGGDAGGNGKGKN